MYATRPPTDIVPEQAPGERANMRKGTAGYAFTIAVVAGLAFLVLIGALLGFGALMGR